MIEGYITVREAAEKWGLHVRLVLLMCSEGRIPGIMKFGRAWAIPNVVEPPKDGTVKSGEYRDWRNNLKKPIVTSNVYVNSFN